MIFADGTDKVVDVEKKDGNNNTLVANPKVDGAFNQYSEQLATYDESKGVYTLTFITNQTAQNDLAGYENFYDSTDATIDGSVRGTFTAGAHNEEKATVSRAYFYDTSSVFVKYKTDEYKVVSGKAVKGWDAVSPSMIRVLTEKDSNSQYIGAAFVNISNKNTLPGGSDKTYAVALGDARTDKIDGTTYTVVKAWNGSAEDEYKYEGTKTIVKGDIFEYSADGEGTVDINVLKHASDSTQVATYDAGSGEITFADSSIITTSGKAFKIDSKDTTVLYVDSSNGKGETKGEIQLAPKFNGDDDNTDKNVTVYVEDGENKNITVIVVDVKNKIDW